MEKRNQGYEESLRKINTIESMTEEEFVTVAKQLIRTITLDRKQIEDRYIITRKEFSDIVRRTIMNEHYNPTARQKENDRSNIMLKYIEYIKEEARLDYNRRLLQMIK